MTNWLFYPVIVATVVSVFGLSRIALKAHDHTNPRSLSELAAAEQSLLVRFRNILIFCGLLFAVTLFGLIVPRVGHGVLTAFFGVLMIGGELLASALPARHKTMGAHFTMAQVMAVGMFGLVALFWLDLSGGYVGVEAGLGLLMVLFAALTFLDKRHFIVYELAFIFASHFSIVAAAVALR